MNPLEHHTLFSLAWPLIVTIGLGIALPIMDAWFLSQVSDHAAAGVGALGPVIFVLFNAIQSFSLAGANIASQFQGAGLYRKAKLGWNLQIALSLLIGFFASALIWSASGYLGLWLGLKNEAYEASVAYLRLLGPGMVFKSLQIALTNLANSQGLTKLNLSSNLLALASNAFLNWLFISGVFGLPRLGIQGIALATVLSWIIMNVYLWTELKQRLGLKPRRREMRRGMKLIFPDWLRIGIPAAVEPVSFQLHQVVITALVVRLGMLATTSRVYAANIALLPVIFSLGLGIATQTLIAHQVGAGRFDLAHQTLTRGLRYAAATAFGIALISAASGKFLLLFFTRDPQIIALGSAALWIDAWLQPAKAGNIVLTSALRASGDSRFPAITGSAMMWTLGIGAVLGLGYGLKWGLLGLWGGMAIDEWSRVVINWMRWRGGQWRQHALIHQNNRQ